MTETNQLSSSSSSSSTGEGTAATCSPTPSSSSSIEGGGGSQANCHFIQVNLVPVNGGVSPSPSSSSDGNPTSTSSLEDKNNEGRRKRGKCKWFNVAKGWGFITPEDGSQEVFVHQSVIQMSGFRSLGDAEEVEFECKESGKGLEATVVTGLDGSECVGSNRRPIPVNKKKVKKIRCYNCGDLSHHVAAKCSLGPMPKRCHNCKSVEHLIADCPKREKSEESNNNNDTSDSNDNNNDNIENNNNSLKNEDDEDNTPIILENRNLQSSPLLESSSLGSSSSATTTPISDDRSSPLSSTGCGDHDELLPLPGVTNALITTSSKTTLKT